MSDLKINIHGRNDNNNITEKEYPIADADSIRIAALGGLNASKNVRIIFEPSSIEKLFEVIRWGSKYKRTDVEQAGMLIGRYYRDSSGDQEVIWADVLVIISADPVLVNASFTDIDITTAAWKKMYDDAAEFRTENLQILGWYHTHLDTINTRFSGVDRRTQQKAFTFEYSFGVVFNPNQEKWSAFYGPDSRECVGELIYDDLLSTKYGKPKISIKQVNGDSELREDGSVVHLNEEGQPIQPQLNLSVKTKSEDEGLSLGQFFGHILVGIGQRMSKPKRSVDAHRTVPSKELQQLLRSSAPTEERVEAPKIEIRNVSQVQPAIRCRYFSISSDDKFSEQPNFRCSVKKDDIEEIIRYRQDSIVQNKFLWGDIRRSGTDMFLILVDERNANAKIIILKNNASSEVDELVARGFQRIIKQNIRFIVLIDDANSQSINVRIIHFSRENVI